MAIRLTLCLVLLWFAWTTAAQERIEYGQIIQDSFTETDYEHRYGFIGSAGDVILAELYADDLFGKLNSPVLILTDSQGNVLADTTGVFSFKEARLAAVLPSMQSYVLIATRENGINGESVGTFSLKVSLLAPVESHNPLKLTVRSGGPAQYFAVDRQEPFSVLYRRLDGDFSPQVTLYQIGERGQLVLAAALYGPRLTTGMLGSFVGSEPLILGVGEAFDEFDFEEREAAIEVMIVDTVRNVDKNSP